MSIAATQWRPLLVIATWCGVLVVAVTAAWHWRAETWRSWRGIGLASLPSALFLALFYSLALHMYWSLGAWPVSIGDEGFPRALLAHDDVVFRCVQVGVMVGLFVWPAAVVLSLAIRRLRVWIGYVAAYGLSNVVCLGLMLLAPSKFLEWWFD